MIDHKDWVDYIAAPEDMAHAIIDLINERDKLLAVARAAKDAAERLDSSDSGWCLDVVREALAALESE